MESRSQLLTVDGAANLLLGLFLLAGPRPLFWLLVLFLVGLSTAEIVAHRRSDRP